MSHTSKSSLQIEWWRDRGRGVVVVDRGVAIVGRVYERHGRTQQRQLCFVRRHIAAALSFEIRQATLA